MTGGHRYPEGTVRAILDTEFVTAQTALALRQRIGEVAPHTAVLDADGMAVLAAVCERLIPQPDRAEPIDLAARLHHAVATAGGDGWRYATLPTDEVALIQGVSALDASARTMTSRGFCELDADGHRLILSAVQKGVAPKAAWPGLDQARWFEELLAAVTEIYFSHPLAQEEIGYLGMADAQGWDEVGFGARAAFEPVEALRA